MLFFSKREQAGLCVGSVYQSAYLQLNERETAASADPSVILDGRASHNRSELVDGARGQSSSLGLTSSTSPRLLAGLFPHKNSQYLVSRFPPPHLWRGGVGFFFGSSFECPKGRAYLIKVGANPTLPILAEIYGGGVSSKPIVYRRFGLSKCMLTVADDLLVVLDRLNWE